MTDVACSDIGPGRVLTPTRTRLFEAVHSCGGNVAVRGETALRWRDINPLGRRRVPGVEWIKYEINLGAFTDLRLAKHVDELDSI